MHEPLSVVGVEILSEKVVGREGGFLSVRSVELRNVRADGSRSSTYVCDFLIRPKGVDAIVVAVYARPSGGRVRVLLRHGLRPALHVGRVAEELPVADAKKYLFFREVVAGIVERGDKGEAGLRQRAVAEVEEEAGYRVRPGDVMFLGAAPFPSPGSLPERFWLAAVEVDDERSASAPAGDGSPMEEGAHTEWMDLDQAIMACVRGEIEDMKTEVVLRRLRDRLGRG